MIPEASCRTSAILDVPISRLGFEEAVQVCGERAKSRSGGYVCFANVHSITEAQSNQALKNVLAGATYTFADGMPLVWVSKIGSHPIASRVCGPDFMARFLRLNPDLNYGFIGGIPGQAELLAARYAPNAATSSPPIRAFSASTAAEDWENFLATGASAPQVVWVGLGAPKQELWMQVVSALAPGTLFFGVGAAFDFLSDRKSRAPRWMQKSGLEWLYRLLQEPRRLWKRYFETNSKFLFYLVARRFIRK